jgi:hypothetical protein
MWLAFAGFVVRTTLSGRGMKPSRSDKPRSGLRVSSTRRSRATGTPSTIRGYQLVSEAGTLSAMSPLGRLPSTWVVALNEIGPGAVAQAGQAGVATQGHEGGIGLAWRPEGGQLGQSHVCFLGACGDHGQCAQPTFLTVRPGEGHTGSPSHLAARP